MISGRFFSQFVGRSRDPHADCRGLFVWMVLGDRVLQMEHLVNHLRMPDSLQFSAALSFAGAVEELQFVCSDRALATAAEAHGLSTICPGLIST